MYCQLCTTLCQRYVKRQSIKYHVLQWQKVRNCTVVCVLRYVQRTKGSSTCVQRQSAKYHVRHWQKIMNCTVICVQQYRHWQKIINFTVVCVHRYLRWIKCTATCVKHYVKRKGIKYKIMKCTVVCYAEQSSVLSTVYKVMKNVGV